MTLLKRLTFTCTHVHTLLVWLLFIAIKIDSVLGMCPASCGMCPCFTESPYTFSIDEDAAIGTTVATVTPTVPLANTGTPSYSIEDSTAFLIDSTGAITLAITLDYETETFYEFVVKATANHYDGRGDVRVNVQNKNDIAPHCSPTVLYYTIAENKASAVFPLSNCTDEDSSTNPNFTYSLDGFNHLFQISSQGIISIMQPLDYEESAQYDLSITVSDSPIPPGSLNTTIRAIILVTPVNEFPPVFEYSQYVFSVSEDTEIGSLIGSVAASDNDAGEDGSVRYSIEPTIGFSMDRTSGDIILASRLDYENKTVYSLNITAVDGSVNTRASYATLRIDITDRNDNSPVFAQSIFYLAVSENTYPNTLLLQVACSDLDSGPFAEISHSIVSGNADNAFVIDTASGNVSLAGALDYEEMMTDLYSLVVQCRELAPPNRIAEALLLVEVTGYNQFRPQASHAEFDATIPEDSAPGTAVITISATDRDRGIDGLLRYTITATVDCPSDVFSIDKKTGTVYLLSHLDYETGSQDYYCLVTISDSGSPRLSSEVDLYIAVDDVNDQAPRCYPAVSTVIVQEDVSIGAFVHRLYCNDSDSGMLTYSIDQSLPFEIDSSGVLLLSSELNYEAVQSYHFSVRISDGDFTTNTTLAVHLQNINEYPPEFSQTSYHCSLPENSTVGTSVSCDDTITAVDQDAGAFGEVRYQLQTPSDFFSLSHTGDLELTGSVDSETQSEFSLGVVAYDLGDPSLSSNALVIITVVDINDNPPVMPAVITTSLAENSAGGLAVARAVCTDEDQGANGIVELRIISTHQFNRTHYIDVTAQDMFAIHSSTGNVTLIGELDYEGVDYFRLLVSCTDGGIPALSSRAILLVSVLPVNDFVPEFINPLSSIRIPEATEIGSVLFTMSAVDNDFGNDGEISFSLSTDSESFGISESSGVVVIARRLNCEAAQQHELVITATDNGQPALSSQTTVTVNVSECHLGQLRPELSVYSTNISEVATIGEAVTSVACLSSRNMDMAHSTEPHYQMVSDDHSSFTINQQSGAITITAMLDYEAHPVHVLKVKCFDPSHRDNSVNVTVYVHILPVNEFAPTFSTDVISLSLSEGTPVGELVAQLQATDEDHGVDGELLYNIEGEGFVINTKTGELFLTTALDRELQDEIRLNVTATDRSPSTAIRMSTRATVVISIFDVNDNPPVCVTSVIHVAVSPGLTTLPVTLLSQFNCTDRDLADNAEIQYQLTADVPSDSPFVIDDGQLVVKNAVSATGPSYYSLPIVAADRGDPSRSAQFLVVVHVQDPGVDEAAYSSLVEAEGAQNSVTFTLKGVTSTALENAETLLKLRQAVAASVTSYCALFPGACSLLSTCSELSMSRRKRATLPNGYPSFSSGSVVVQQQPNSASVLLYVRLPAEADRAHSRVTNYVVPESTLSVIIEQDGETIQALVRDTVNQAQTPIQEWMIVLAVLIGLLGGALLVATVATTVIFMKRHLKRRKGRVVPISVPGTRVCKQDSTPSSRFSLKRVSLTSSLSDTGATCNDSSKPWTISRLASLLRRSSSSSTHTPKQTSRHSSGHSSARSTKGVCSAEFKVPSVFFHPDSEGDNISLISLGGGEQRSGCTSLENIPNNDRRNNRPRTLVNELMKQNAELSSESSPNSLPQTPNRSWLNFSFPRWK